MRAMPRPHAHEDLERNRVASIGSIENRWLRIERHISAQSKLPGAPLHHVANPTERISTDPVRRVNRRFRKQLIFVHQFKPCKEVITLAEVYG